MSLFDDFLVRATLAAVAIALAAAPLGCFVVWRRMAYFGDATAHAAILGVALALGFSISIFAGVALVCLAMALLVTGLEGRGLATDTVLGVLSHSGLAFGLVAAAFIPGVRVDLSAYLFGDILAVSKSDLVLIWLGVVVVITLIWLRWSALLTATVSADLAYAAQIRPDRERLVITLALAVVVAVGIKVVGALLIGAMLLIPTASARTFARTPEAMVFGAALIGSIAAAGGMQTALALDTPAGPTIVCVAALIFSGAQIWQHLR